MPTGDVVWAVEWGNEFPAEIDSLWRDADEADKRCAELGKDKGWRVQPWKIREKFEAEKPR